MGQNKKSRAGKKYVPRSTEGLKLKHQPWRLHGVFSQPLDIIDQLEQTHTITTENGIPVHRDINTGKLHETLPALGGFIELFELYEEQYKNPLPLEPLRVLYDKIADEDCIIDSDDTKAVRATIEVIRKAMFELTRAQADELVSDYLLKEALNGNVWEV